jgi:MoxR-like ATPase
MSVAAALSILAGIRQPALLIGPPGTGKTSMVNALGQAYGGPTETVICSIREPSDFSGLPVLVDGRTLADGRQTAPRVHLAPPAWAVRLAKAGRGILFFDEITTAPPAVQAALLRVVLDRVVGDLVLPEQVAVLAAANPPEQAAGGWQLAPPLANRFTHMLWKNDYGAWADGMESGWPPPEFLSVPNDWEQHIPAAASLVAAFIRHRPTMLLQFPKDEASQGGAWPSNRTWTMSSRLMAACDAVKASDEVRHLLLAGTVGDAATLEFLNWRRNLDLPDPEELLRHPESLKLPERSDLRYAVLSSVAAAIVARPTPDRWKRAWLVIIKAADDGAPDTAAQAARTLARVRPAGATPPPEIVRFMPLFKRAGIRIA